MDNKKNIFIVIVIFLGLASIFFGRGYIQKELQKILLRLNTPAIHNGKISVVTSFYPLAYFASEVGGERVEVRNITPSGAEPHDFEPSPREIASLMDADLFIYNGTSFEPWAKKRIQTQTPHPLPASRSIDMVSKEAPL